MIGDSDQMIREIAESLGQHYQAVAGLRSTLSEHSQLGEEKDAGTSQSQEHGSRNLASQNYNLQVIERALKGQSEDSEPDVSVLVVDKVASRRALYGPGEATTIEPVSRDGH